MPTRGRENTAVRRIGLVVIVLAFSGAPAGAAFNEGLRDYLLTSFERLAGVRDVAVANDVCRMLNDPEIADSDWQEFFHGAFAPTRFTDLLNEFWEYAIHQAGPARSRMTLLSCLCAAEAAGEVLAGMARNPAAVEQGALMAALTRLGHTAPALSEERRKSVYAALAEPLRDIPLDLMPMLRPGSAVRPDLERMGMQIALTLSACAPKETAPSPEISAVLNLPEPVQTFWARHGVFVFDNATLDARQLQVLDSLIEAMPKALHNVATILVPAGYGLDSMGPGLAVPGQVLSISAMPGVGQTNGDGPGLAAGRSVRAAFAIEAAQQMLRAIQALQFDTRPALAMQRERILAREARRRAAGRGARADSMIRLDDPDEVLPAAGSLWFADSEAAFRLATDRLARGQPALLEILLLLADMLSGGGNSTLLFTTDNLGAITARPTPIGRVHLGAAPVAASPASSVARMVSVDCVNSLKILDELWSFDLDNLGGVLRRNRNHGGLPF